jgi:hypothetical protein
MKRVLSLATAVFFTATTFAQENTTKTPVSAPAAAQTSAQKEAAHAAESKHSTPEQKAKQFTDQINKAVPLSKEVYQRVMKVNIDFQMKKEQITAGKKDKELTKEQLGLISQQKTIRRAQLQTAMGKELYTKWQTANQKKGGKPSEKDSSED